MAGFLCPKCFAEDIDKRTCDKHLVNDPKKSPEVTKLLKDGIAGPAPSDDFLPVWATAGILGASIFLLLSMGVFFVMAGVKMISH